MSRLLLFVATTSLHLHLLSSQESVHYLQSAITQLRNMKTRQGLSRKDFSNREDSGVRLKGLPVRAQAQPRWGQASEQSANSKSDTPGSAQAYTAHTARLLQRHRDPNAVPPLSLTKGELSAIYEAALAKGDTVKFDAGDDTIMATAVHEMRDSATSASEESLKAHVPPDNYDTNPAGDVAGYYYYYYPIKSFFDEMASQSQVNEHEVQPTHTHGTHAHGPVKDNSLEPHYQYHSHAHQHTVNLTALKTMLEGDKKKKALEPLFMAISGFIGMAVMFVLSVLVLPKFGLANKKPNVKKAERFGDLAKIALQAIEKQECAERLACELGKTARTFNLGNNRFVKLLKRLAPSTFGKQMEIVENYGKRRFRCTAIPCKKKRFQEPKPNQKQKKKS